MLGLLDGTTHPITLARLPADAVYAPVADANGEVPYFFALGQGDVEIAAPLRGIDSFSQLLIENAGPPAEVIDAFNEVQRARQDETRLQEEARSYANTLLGDARGRAAALREDAAAAAYEKAAKLKRRRRSKRSVLKPPSNAVRISGCTGGSVMAFRLKAPDRKPWLALT